MTLTVIDQSTTGDSPPPASDDKPNVSETLAGVTQADASNEPDDQAGAALPAELTGAREWLRTAARIIAEPDGTEQNAAVTRLVHVMVNGTAKPGELRAVRDRLVTPGVISKSDWADEIREAKAEKKKADRDWQAREAVQEAEHIAATAAAPGRAPVRRDLSGLPLGARKIPGSSGYLYAPSGIYRACKSRAQDDDDQEDATEIIDWCPVVAERGVTLAERGAPARRYYVIRVGDDEATVMHADVTAGECWDQFADAVGVGTRLVRDVLSNVIQAQARDLPRTVALERTGWHELDGRRFYVFEDGRTVPGGLKIRMIDMPTKMTAAVREPDRWATRAEMAAAAGAMAGRGWGPLLGLGSGLRSLGQSIRPVRTGMVPTGGPGTGKSLTAWMAQQVRCDSGYPPIAMASFSDTKADIEVKADRARDQVGLVDDLALTLESSEFELKEGRDRLEAVLRSLFNDVPVRGRRGRTMEAARSNEIQCYPIITAQMLPPLQPSLYRRFIEPHYEPGDNDARWYGAKDDAGNYVNSHPLVLPARTMGQRMLELLAASASPRAVLAGNDAEAVRRFAPFADAAIPGWAERDDCFREVVEGAAAEAGGLAFAADFAGLADRWELFGIIAPKLAGSLARQARVMENRQAAADDLGTAVGAAIRTALLNLNAHICDDSARVTPCIPGLSEQEQGVQELGDHGWTGRGIPFYYVPDHGGLGVRSDSLHVLLTSSRDARTAIQGHTALSLPAELLKRGVITRSTQKDRAAVSRIRVGPGSPKRLMVMPVSVVWPDLDEPTEKIQSPGEPASNSGNSGNSGNIAGQGLEGNGNGSSDDKALTRHVPAVPAVPAISARISNDGAEISGDDAEAAYMSTAEPAALTLATVEAGRTAWTDAGRHVTGSNLRDLRALIEARMDELKAAPCKGCGGPLPSGTGLAVGGYHVSCDPGPAPAPAAEVIQPELGDVGDEDQDDELAAVSCQVCGELLTGADDHPDCIPAAEKAPRWPAFDVMRKTLESSRMHPLWFIQREDRETGPWPDAIQADGSVEAGFRWALPGAAQLDGNRTVVPFDRGQSFPSACSSVPVAPNKLVRHGPLDSNPKDLGDHGSAGIVKMVAPEEIAGMPHPLGRRARPGEEIWVPSGLAEMLWKLHIQGVTDAPVVTDSWLGRRTVGLFDDYGKAVRAARREHAGNPEMTAAVKRSASTALRVLYPVAAKSPWWRPDWRAAIVGEAMTRIWMVAYRAVQDGAVLVSASTVDQVAYLLPEDADPATWAPPGYKLGKEPGTYHWGDTRVRSGADLTGIDPERVKPGQDPKVQVITGPCPVSVWAVRRG